MNAALAAFTTAAATTPVTPTATNSWKQDKTLELGLWQLRHSGQAQSFSAASTKMRSDVIPVWSAGDQWLQGRLWRFAEDFRQLLSDQTETAS